jgi:hypothetical protein
MDDDSNDHKNPDGKLIVFPGGKSVSTSEIGTNYVVGQGGAEATISEIVDPTLVNKESRERENFVQNQELVKALARSANASELVDTVIQEIAEELAHLKFERGKAAREGKNTANYNMSRIAALKQIADVLMKRQESARAEQLDLKSPRFQLVLRAWMEFVYNSMTKAGLKDTDIELTFAQMKADMIDWEKSVISIQV